MDRLAAFTSAGNTLWPRAFLVMSAIVAVLTCAAVVTNFTSSSTRLSPGLVVLNVFCIFFSLYALSIEMRQFAPCRRVVYYWLRYAYVLVDYLPRAFFYVFLGTLMLGATPLMLATGVVAMVVGVVMGIVGATTRLPTWQDAAEQRQAEDDMERYYGVAPSSATAVAARAGATSTPAAPTQSTMSPASPHDAVSRTDYSPIAPPTTDNAGASGGPESAYAKYMRAINEDRQAERSQQA